MSVTTVTHINLRGQARAALAFYQAVFSGELTQVTYAQMGNVQDPADAEHIIWGQVVAANGFRIMACDVAAATPWHQGENAYFISLRGDSVEEIAALWRKLGEGGAVLQALAPTVWTPLYGMLKDRFGVVWVVDVAAAGA
jgi:PhnB protein